MNNKLSDPQLNAMSFELMEVLPIGVALFQAVKENDKVVDFVTLRKNKAFTNAVGPASDIGHRYFEQFPVARSTDTATRFLEAVQRVLAGESSETIETFTPSSAESYLYDIVEAGVADHFLIVLRRIYDGLEGEQQIHRLLQEQEFLFESQNIGYWKSVNRVISWTNATFDNMLGYQRHELRGECTRIVYTSAELFDSIGQKICDAEQAKAGIHLNMPLLRKDGSTAWFEITLQQITEDSGQVTMIGSLIDRSNEHSAMLALQFSEQRLKACLQGSGAAYFDWNLITGELVFDNSIQSIFGTEAPKTFEDILTLAHRSDRDIVQRYISGHMDSDTLSSGCEFRFRHCSGNWIWVLLRGSIVESDAPNGDIPVRIAGTITDVTATKRIERETEKLLHRLEHLIKERASQQPHLSGDPTVESMLATLSRRQTEVLRLIASGCTSIEIADQLHISEATVQSHRKEIMQKLGQKNIATLTQFAIKAGIL